LIGLTEQELIQTCKAGDRKSQNLLYQKYAPVLFGVCRRYLKTERDATIFNLYAIEGYTHREIAEKLDISINTSKSQLIKARKKLKELLIQYQYNVA